MFKILFAFLIVLGVSFSAEASHVLGGEITWKCVNGNYVFKLVFYRDCNENDVSTAPETIRVWNHPTLTSISLPFASRIDISPTCNQVAGGPNQLACGTGTNGGNGAGAIEKISYQSAPLAIVGTPPSQGWIFTYETFSRSNAITNITNPATYGITLAAKMFKNGSSGCVDNSPEFLQDPYFISCAGDPYQYNMHAVDRDLDSIHVEFSRPLNNFPTGTFNPPTNPILIPFEPGFSYLSPTPSSAVNPLNVAAAIDPQSGELTFQSVTSGNYVIKVKVQSFRNGILMAEIEREMQLTLSNCSSGNNAPIVAPPFTGGFYETTVVAGTLVNFDVIANDLDLLQNGSPQHVLINSSSLQYGTNYTANTGCLNAPCATLNATPIITGVSNATASFNWQTACNHLVGAGGIAYDTIPYQFVFKIQDDFCPIPKIKYITVTVNVINQGVIQAPAINCIHVNPSTNQTTIEWNPVSNPSNSFVAYEIYSVQSGLIGTLNSISAASFTFPTNLVANGYYLAVVSGCNGNTKRFSDTLKCILLNVTNPLNGTAVLNWNAPTTATAGIGSYYQIYREYPSGTWTLIDSVPLGTNFYKDTIYICEAQLNYQIVLPATYCDFSSTIDGDLFEDMLTPSIPIINGVSIDTLNNAFATISWSVNDQPDTYGYVIYGVNAAGFLTEIDTVWGINSTTYTHPVNVTSPLTYSVAAFDSCFTVSVPVTYQTSAKANPNTSMYLTYQLEICDNTVQLNWTDYSGWTTIQTYEVYGSKNNGNWLLMGNGSNSDATITVEALQNYCFYVKAIGTNGNSATSNKICLSVIAPTQASVHYLKVATVNQQQIDLKHLIDTTAGVAKIAIERKKETEPFVEITRLPITSSLLTYSDFNVEVDKYSYTYRARIIDSCGSLGAVSNNAKTILLSILKNDVKMETYLQWSEYESFNGSILAYSIYRGIDGVFSTTPLANVSSDSRTYTDTLSSLNFNGKICYKVEAIEGSNSYNAPEKSQSNEACAVIEPLIYIPNAFMPDGVNKLFIPVLTNFDPSNYSFTIIDRIGQTLFETSNYLEGWNGTTPTGSNAAVGTYIYRVQLTDGFGETILKYGHVTLIR